MGDGYLRSNGRVCVRDPGNSVLTRQSGRCGTRARRRSAPQSRAGWRDRFDVNKADLLPTGTNAYITMEPSRVLKLRHGNDTLIVTVLSQTQEVDGVVTGVLEERETKNGKLIEVSRNFLATDRNTGDVYYFGEDVDNYKNGKVVDHESAWRAGI